jgi:TetR/AcrR family transcriptional regulator
MPRPLRASPDVILEAAAREFAERGFAGARVDRIARRARVNKAMLYYHFKSKQSLYRHLLLGMFSMVAARLQTIAGLDRPPAEKIDLAIAGLAEFIQDHAVFPAIMLREVAEGGAHLDRETLKALGAVPAAIARIVHEGVAAGAFRPVHPVFAYFSMLTPLVLFLAGAPMRKEISDLHLVDMGSLSTGEFVAQLQESARRSLARDTPARKKATR